MFRNVLENDLSYVPNDASIYSTFIHVLKNASICLTVRVFIFASAEEVEDVVDDVRGPGHTVYICIHRCTCIYTYMSLYMYIYICMSRTILGEFISRTGACLDERRIVLHGMYIRTSHILTNVSIWWTFCVV